MLYIAILVLLTILFYTRTRQFFLDGIILTAQGDYERLKNEYDLAKRENQKLKSNNSDLQKVADETAALYDITKDICEVLDEEEVFSVFKDSIHKYIEIEECRFIRKEGELEKNDGYTVLPLKIERLTIGYLVAGGVKKADLDKFHILAQQFLLGIKRALLYKKVQEFSITDTLTRVFNRRYLLERLSEELERSKKFYLNFSFLMIDIDHFKSFNDRYGHLVGDVILKETSRLIKRNLRQIDLIARYGGEEFSLILTMTDKEKARFAAERIRQSVEQGRIRAYDEDLKVTISIGLSTFPADAQDMQALIENADNALYLAKERGRNRVCAYEGKPQ